MDIDIHSHAPETKAGIGGGTVTHDEVMRLFEEFKAANDERLDEIARRSADVVTEDKVERINSALTRRIDELSLIECPAFVVTILHALWIGHEAGINGFANLSALLMTYFGARFGVLGVYVSGRSREKQAGVTGELPPSVFGELLKAAIKKK